MLEGLKEAMEYLVDLGTESELPKVEHVDGAIFSKNHLVRINPNDYASAIETSSLSSIVDYIENMSAEFRLYYPDNKMILHIVSPKEVKLMSPLDDMRKRETLIRAEAVVNDFKFGNWYTQDSFILSAQANFRPSMDRDILLKFAGNVKNQRTETYTDDGVTQVAAVKMGAATVEDVVVPNPVELTPFRTFQEVEQPTSNFIFRMSSEDQPRFMLTEADNKLWKNKAVWNIKEYFRKELERIPEDITKKIAIIG